MSVWVSSKCSGSKLPLGVNRCLVIRDVLKGTTPWGAPPRIPHLKGFFWFLKFYFSLILVILTNVSCIPSSHYTPCSMHASSSFFLICLWQMTAQPEESHYIYLWTIHYTHTSLTVPLVPGENLPRRRKCSSKWHSKKYVFPVPAVWSKNGELQQF